MAETLIVTLQDWNTKTLRPNNDEESWGVYQFCDEQGGRIKGVGVLHNGLRRKGVRMTLEGAYTKDKYSRDPTNCWQFTFTNHVVCHPAGKKGMMAFLKMAPHIGNVTALELWAKFGEKAAETLVQRPQEVEDAGILRGERLMEAAETIKCGLDEANYYMPLQTLFAGIGFPKSLVKQVIAAKWGDPVKKIQENPFVLLDFHGVGFLKVDTLRAREGLPHNMPERLYAAVRHIITQRTTQVWVGRNTVHTELGELISLNAPTLNLVIDNAIAHKIIVIIKKFGRFDWIIQINIEAMGAISTKTKFNSKTSFEFCALNI